MKATGEGEGGGEGAGAGEGEGGGEGEGEHHLVGELGGDRTWLEIRVRG